MWGRGGGGGVEGGGGVVVALVQISVKTGREGWMGLDRLVSGSGGVGLCQT